MKTLLIILCLFTLSISAQEINPSKIPFQLERKSAYLFADNQQQTAIDLMNGNTSRNDLIFENGEIFKTNGSDRELIGKYSNRHITIGDINYKLRRPVFSKTILINQNNPEETYTLEPQKEGDSTYIVFDKSPQQLPEAVELWALYRAIHRVYDTNEWNSAILISATAELLSAIITGK